jgi:hypothetical protein
VFILQKKNMSTNKPNDLLEFNDGQKPTLPGSLNVLTILTFIGSSLFLIYALALPKLMSFFKSMMDKAATSGQEMSSKQMQDIEKGRKGMELVMNNMVPLVIITIVGALLCIYGAVMMRKLKKDGFWIYLCGELLPVIAGFILMGTAQFSGVMSVILGLGLPIVFVILYSVQRKYLIN